MDVPQKGGKTVYFGSVEQRARPLVQYLENIEGTEKLPSHTNPADWMLNVRGWLPYCGLRGLRLL